MSHLQQKIEALAQRLTAADAERDSLEEMIDKLQRRIEALEGKGRSAVYDPATNSVAEALIESIAISKPCVGDRARLERSLEIPPGSSPLLFDEMEKHLKRPGGLLEQFEKETTEAKSAAPERYEILEPRSGEKVPTYIIGGRVFIPLDKANDLLPRGPEMEPMSIDYMKAKLEEGFAEMERTRKN